MEPNPNSGSEKPGIRRSDRVDLVTPVEIRAAASRTVGLTENISLGGLLLQCSQDFQAGGGIDVLFNLPTGLSVKARCSVAHVQAQTRVGLRFVDLEAQYEQMLEEFIREMVLHMRQHKAIAKRLYVIMKGCQGNHAQGEVAETIVLSRRGGVLICRAKFEAGDKVFLWSPDRKQGALARIVSRRPRGTTGLIELGFEFQDSHDLWGIAED